LTASRSKPRPCTTFVGGINPFLRLGALPKTKPSKPPKPKPIMQKPAKPAKTRIKDEDYSTPYKPPVSPPATMSQKLEGLPALDALRIEDNVPFPTHVRYSGGMGSYAKGVLNQLGAGQSLELPMKIRHSLANAVTAYYKANSARFVMRLFKDTNTLRIWRVA
jgi:hypothetical protein